MSQATSTTPSPPLFTRVRTMLPAHVWGYLQREMLYLSWAVMDTALLVPLALALMSWGRYWPSTTFFFWLLLVQLLAFNLTRLLSAARIPISKQRLWMVGGLFLTFLFTMRLMLYPVGGLFSLRWLTAFYGNIAEAGNLLWLRDAVVFMLTLIVWWRGIRLATRQFHLARAGSRLRMGVLLFVPSAVWYTNGRVASGGSAESIIPFILIFFLMGLTAVALVRAEEVSTKNSGHAASLRPRWLLFIFGVAWGTVSVVGVVAAIISGQLSLLISKWLAPVWTAVFFLWAIIRETMLYLITPFLLLTGLFAELVINLINGLFTSMGIDELPAITIPAPGINDVTPEATEEVLVLTTAPPDVKIITILLMVAGILLVALFLGKLFREATLIAREGSDSERPFANEKLPRMSLGERILDRLGLLKNWKTAVSIRRLYQQMEKTAAQAGYPRAATETPYEYQTTLAEAWPEQTAETSQLTIAYVNVRYGEFPETEAEIDALKAALKRLKSNTPEQRVIAT